MDKLLYTLSPAPFGCAAMQSSTEDKVQADLETKLAKHRQVLESTRQLRPMLRDRQAIANCEAQIREYEKSIEYLEEQLCQRRFSGMTLAGGGMVAAYADDDDNEDPADEAPSNTQQPNNWNQRYSRLDLIKSQTPYNTAKIANKLQELEYKFDVETRLAAGLQRMVQVVEQDSAKLSDRRKSLAQKQLQESLQKTALLESARKRYKRLYIEDEQDRHSDDMVVPGNGMASALASSVSGYLQIRIIEARDLEHMPTKWGKSPDTLVVAKIDGKPAFESKPSRNCKWLEKHAVHINRGSELELEIHDQAGDNRSPIGVLWISIMDVAEEMRRKKVQRQNTLLLTNESNIIFPEEAPPWASRSTSASPLSALASSVRNCRNSLTSESSSSNESSNESNNDNIVSAWFDVEPQGEIHLELNFVRESPSRRPFNKLGRMGAVREKHNVVRDIRGHRFVQKKFFNVMKCAFCSEFLVKTGYQCEDCIFTCHEKCVAKVFTKCITNVDSGPDDELVSHRIPHRFVATNNIGAHWCCHCGYVLPFGRRSVERCSECNVLCHARCSHLVPALCGAPPLDVISERFRETVIAARHRNYLPQVSPRETSPQHPLSSPESYVTASESMDQSGIQTNDSLPRTGGRSAEYFDPLALRNSPAAQSIPHVPMAHPHRESASSSESSYLNAYVKIDEQLHRDHATTSHVSSTTTQESSEARRFKIGLQDFTLLKVLGRGNFGKVLLAQYQRDGEVYAIKILKKRSALDFEDVQGIRIEKRVFEAANQERHPFLVNLHSCFQTHAHLCFVMEYVNGGDLMSHIQREPFSERRAKFYACEVLCALEYFHQRGIIYRDLKLDNILLCKDGHIKLADYGLCKDNMWIGCTTNTFCGTPDFMAPEIVLHQEYGQEVDWWAFGVLIYQMLLGMPPFWGEDDQEIAGAILNDDVMYPINMSKNAISLCKQLLNRDRSNRLTGAASVKQHAFFKGVNWDDVLAKRVRPPFFPTVKGAADTSNFDDEFTVQRPVLTPIASALTSAEQEEFAGFSYTADWAL